jgi:hypothetical protein
LPASDQSASGSSSGSSSGMKMDHEGKAFTVSQVEMVSSTCDMNK